MATPADSLPPVKVAGLLVPAALAPRIVAALRATYPGLAADKDDDAVVRAVLHYWIASTLETYEISQAANALAGAKAKLDQDHFASVEAIRKKARQAAATITEDPSLTESP